MPKPELIYQYVKITLMYEDRPQGLFCEPIDKEMSFYDLNSTGETTKESKEWFKVEFVKMTEKEYNELPEFTGF